MNVTFMTSEKASQVAELDLTLPKYCKTFDSPKVYMFNYWRKYSKYIRYCVSLVYVCGLGLGLMLGLGLGLGLGLMVSIMISVRVTI